MKKNGYFYVFMIFEEGRYCLILLFFFFVFDFFVIKLCEGVKLIFILLVIYFYF